jgi:hypothetical protein
VDDLSDQKILSGHRMYTLSSTLFSVPASLKKSPNLAKTQTFSIHTWAQSQVLLLKSSNAKNSAHSLSI